MSVLETKSHRSCRREAACAALVALLILYANPSRAQGEPREQARVLAAQGFDALQRRDYASAEDLFRRADELVHAPTLVLDHARALVGLGKLVEGHEGFAQVLREGVPANAPWQWKKALDAASVELAAVEHRLAWLTITVKGAQAPDVEIDGKPVPDAAQGVRRATNPGFLTVRVRADGFLAREKVIELKEGQTETVEFELERDPNAPAPAPRRAAPAVIFAAPAVKPPDHTLATVLLIAGGVGIATGAVTGLIALSTHSSLQKNCPGGVCVPTNDSNYSDDQQQLDRYRALGTASGVAFAMGVGATLSGGALLLFTGQQPASNGVGPKASVTHPSLGVGLGSLQVSGSF